MELYSGNQHYKLYHGNMLDMGQVIEGWTIDSIVTDPPYWLTSTVKRFGKENSAPNQYWKDGSFARLTKWFMGKEWDGSWIEYNIDAWRKCFEALKPWGYLLAFWWSRTYHRIACAIEDAGFEIRDCIMWLYGSWFPKSLNIWLAIDKKNWVESEVVWEWKSWVSSRAYQSEEQTTAGEYQIKKATNEWAWWGTALKPSYEPIIVARKPLEWSCTDNVIKYWVGGINIDGCRVETDDNLNGGAYSKWEYDTSDNVYKLWLKRIEWQYEQPQGRFPANTILTYWDDDKEEVCWWFHNNEQRYYYTAKASKRDRDEGLDGFEAKTKVFNWQSSKSSEDMKDVEKRFTTVGRNTHPTVKPTDLMQYLVRLVTPNGWTVLDPFNWSGSTWKAVMYENKDRNKNYKYIWIELTDEYLPIAKARIEYVLNAGGDLKEVPLF